ncbi:MAG: hypothetical protein A4S14_07875 [Proteobacteria bacterium SG_bin9]|nr:MAG: hypothetical protein A4S14_07875 [Proteobacteria bacterium SG_bin9]
MKRGILLVFLFVVLAAGAVYASSFALIRHEDVNFYDVSRARSIEADIYVNRISEAKAKTGVKLMPVAIVNHGYTVKNKEYKFLTKVLAARGYLVVSLQHDLESDPPLSYVGYPYVGRKPMYERAVANILYSLRELKNISMFFAMQHPEMVNKIITLDNLRVPLLANIKAKVLSIRSDGAQGFKPDPGVVPDDATCEEAGIEVVKMHDAQHVQMSDRGPDSVKAKIAQVIWRFLGDDDDKSAKVAQSEKK